MPSSASCAWTQQRSTPGSGLGLSLVDAVAKLHDAKLTLADNQPGLRVTLAFKPAPAVRGPNRRAPRPPERSNSTPIPTEGEIDG